MTIAVIVVGAPRSGTYWVVDILQTRFNIHLPSETHFIPLFSRFLWLWGDLSVASNRHRLLRDIYQFLQIWTPRSSDSPQYRAQIRPLSLLATLDEGRGDAIVAASGDYPSLVEALFTEFASLHDADASGDKSAHYRVLDPSRTLDYFQDAKMLHVIRDGRDVAMSWVKQWFGPNSITDAAQLWRDHVEVNREWGRRHAGRYLEIRYEDLATDEEGEIRQLEKFLGRAAYPVSEGVAPSALAQALAETASHTEMLDIVAAENVSKWQLGMSGNDIAAFERVAAATLKASGYPVSLPAVTQSGIRRTPISLHGLRVLAKTVLPLVLGISTRLRFPILGLVNRRFPAEWHKT